MYGIGRQKFFFSNNRLCLLLLFLFVFFLFNDDRCTRTQDGIKRRSGKVIWQIKVW